MVRTMNWMRSAGLLNDDFQGRAAITLGPSLDFRIS